jgi:hypothetical protein
MAKFQHSATGSGDVQMSGRRMEGGERERCPVHGKSRRLSRADLSEIRRAIDIENSKAKRKGVEPKPAQVTMFACRCNCFSVSVT